MAFSRCSCAASASPSLRASPRDFDVVQRRDVIGLVRDRALVEPVAQARDEDTRR